ncbi:MAG: sulfite exporter TauE/SafE family protein [Chlamydiales bacterium]|nr:sulfite exporter TauE/SafE family protein [Chlamydiales bacterium]
MMLVALLLYALIGTTAGLFAGLLGISGGVITVPCLFFIFRFLDFPQAFSMHLAIGTSLAAMFFNGVSSTLAHKKRNGVVWEIFKGMLPGIVLGSLIGAFFADRLSSVILEMIFGLFACLLGIHFLRPFFNPKAHQQKAPGKSRLGLYGLLISFISNILGIGGGIITVPTLLHHQVPEKKAIGTSAATGMVVSLFGAIFYLYYGLDAISFPYSVGYLYLPAFIIISVTSSITAIYGAFLTSRLSPAHLRRIFGIALIAIGIIMLLF